MARKKQTAPNRFLSFTCSASMIITSVSYLFITTLSVIRSGKRRRILARSEKEHLFGDRLEVAKLLNTVSAE